MRDSLDPTASSTTMSISASRKSVPVTSSLRFGAALAVFLILTLAAASPLLHLWDERITIWLQLAAPIPDLPTALFVFLGDAEVVIPVTALMAIWFFRRDRRRGTAGFWLVAGLVSASLVAVALKHLIVHPGPPLAFQRHVISYGLYADTPYSFPSGHTLRTTLLAGVTLKRSPWLAGLVIFAMMAALVYAGDHWASDVLGGLSLGWAAVEFAAIRTARLPNYRRG